MPGRRKSVHWFYFREYSIKNRVDELSLKPARNGIGEYGYPIPVIVHDKCIEVIDGIPSVPPGTIAQYMMWGRAAGV